MATLNQLLETNNTELYKIREYLKSVKSLSDKVFLTQLTINDCWGYITSEINKNAQNGLKSLNEEDIFSLAAKFYDENLKKTVETSKKVKIKAFEEEKREKKLKKVEKIEKKAFFEEISLFKG